MAKVEQNTLGGKVIATFTPTKNFASEELKSEYVEGMSYNIREGNDKLIDLVAEWHEAGLVK